MDTVRSNIDSYISVASYTNDCIFGSKEAEQAIFALNAGRGNGIMNLTRATQRRCDTNGGKFAETV